MMSMAASVFSDAVLRSKFRGCMLGAVLGDCLGRPFEGDMCVSKRNDYLKNFLTNLMEDSVEILPYSDDTSMTISVASSLIEREEIDSKDMAKKFVDEYYNNPKRGYGFHVPDVFRALRETDYNDIFLPAKMQFDGSGSYGNGAAMRIAPIALFGNNKSEQFILNAVEESSRITHAHQDGYNGAILQYLAVKFALGLDASQILDPVNFVNSLQEKMENIEMKSVWKRLASVFKEMKKPFCESLEKIKNIYLQKQEDISPEEIAVYLGREMSAVRSVPTAIYSFLRGMKPLKDYENTNPFLRTMYFAISVGGDTDTIASMAGSIAGAYYGEEMIPEVLQKRCEFASEIIKLADKLFDVTQKKE